MVNDKWNEGIADELRFWRWYVQTYKGFSSTEYLGGPNKGFPNKDAIEYCIRDMTEPIYLLDVGSGPSSFFANVKFSKDIKVTAADALADEFEKICIEEKIPQVNKPIQCKVEELDKVFTEGEFDIVHMQNALDHTYDPLEGIKQMLKITKKGGYVYLNHIIDVAVLNRYEGLHQWNFNTQGGQFTINSVPVDLSMYPEVKIEIQEDRILVFIKK